MDRQYSKAFFQTFLTALQRACKEHLEFEQVVEVCGYLSLEIDNCKKERYVLSELIQNASDVIISESYCVKAINTVRVNSSKKPQRDENMPSARRHEQIPRECFQEKTSDISTMSHMSNETNFQIQEDQDFSTHYFESNNTPRRQRQAPRASRQRTESLEEIQESPEEALPLRIFSTQSLQDGSAFRDTNELQDSPFTQRGMRHKRKSQDTVTINSPRKRSKEESQQLTMQRSLASQEYPVDEPSAGKASETVTSTPADEGSNNFPIVIKQEDAPFMVITPQDLTPMGESQDEVERLIQGEDNSQKEMEHSFSEGERESLFEDQLISSTPQKPKQPNNGGKLCCADCNYETSFASNLKRHQRFKHDCQIACRTCCKAFRTETELSEHLLSSHTYICDQCGASFKSKNGLNYHKMEHENHFLFVCNICQKGYNRKNLYLAHKRTHLDVQVKPYSCSKCEKLFDNKSNMARHEKQCGPDNAEKLFKCSEPDCSTVCVSQRQLKEHYKGMHEAPRFRCESCDKAFRWRSGFDKHRKICPSVN